jgi:hypothetical protein
MDFHPELPVVVFNQPSWRLASDRVEAFVTCAGGQLGPVTFHTAAGAVQPYAIAPWHGETLPADAPAVLRPLRGDFFCAPFGGNAAPWRGERHLIHGETAGEPWRLTAQSAQAGRTELVAELTTRVRPGRVVKRLELRAGETNVYCRHELHGLAGPMCPGHHAMLAFPEQPGAGRITISPWRHGQVVPEAFESPAQGGYSALKIGARFSDLRRVPLAHGGTTDLTRYPAREGYEDLVMVCAKSGAGPAWTAVSFPAQGYLWFALKNPRLLASTVLWHSNGGRHYAPWSGRHRHVLGLEDVTAYFHLGLAASAAPNPLSRRGIPTVLRLRAGRPLTIPYIMGVTAIPAGFGTVRTVGFSAGTATFVDTRGRRVTTAVDATFLDPKP